MVEQRSAAQLLGAENKGTEVIVRDSDGAVFIRQDVAERVIDRLRAQLTELQRPADAELVGVAIRALRKVPQLFRRTNDMRDDDLYEEVCRYGDPGEEEIVVVSAHRTPEQAVADIFPRIQRMRARAVLTAVAPRIRAAEHGANDTGPVFFYERDYYPLSNFSAFTLLWETSKRDGLQRFDTSEAVYHWEKFNENVPTHKQRTIQRLIREAPSAHEAFKIAEQYRHCRRPSWDAERVDVMRRIIRAKADQHEYVRRKLLATGDRELIENSWRDDFWGWGPNRDGQNMLGKLWMELRAAIRAGADDGE